MNQRTDFPKTKKDWPVSIPVLYEKTGIIPGCYPRGEGGSLPSINYESRCCKEG